MEIEVAEDYTIKLKKVFTPIMLETEEGKCIYICMRDGNIELLLPEQNILHTVNMETGEVLDNKG